MNEECDNHIFGCFGNCILKVISINKNNECLQFEPKQKEIEKITYHTFHDFGSVDYIEKKINELIDAVNELRRKE
jgi:hypothetical protein